MARGGRPASSNLVGGGAVLATTTSTTVDTIGIEGLAKATTITASSSGMLWNYTNTENSSTICNNNNNSGNLKAAKSLYNDPSALLSRGHTARYLGAVLLPLGGGNLITPLSADEVDRDLRHMMAYQTASARYHQIQYVTTNRITNNSSVANKDKETQPPVVTSAAGTTLYPASNYYGTAIAGGPAGQMLLPVRIDPEEEKRLMMQRKKIMKAETIREDLEQQYVALRAHYVVTTQQLQTAATQSYKSLHFLQSCTQKQAALLGIQRSRLQMVRDAMHAVRAREEAILEWRQKYAYTAAADSKPLLSAEELDKLGAIEESCPLLAVWKQLEETHLEKAFQTVAQAETELLMEENKNKEAIESSSGPTSGTNKKETSVADVDMKEKEQQDSKPTKRKRKGAKSNEEAKENASNASSASGDNNNDENTLLWPCVVEPATPRGVPILLSALSQAPEKSVAMSTSNMFGSSASSMVWLESHFPIDRITKKDPTSKADAGSRQKNDDEQTLSQLQQRIPHDDHYHEHPAHIEALQLKSYDELPDRIQILRDEVVSLEQQIKAEQLRNENILYDTCKVRVIHDEWVAMIALIRQETESILHRHNVLLESEVAVEAAAVQQHQLSLTLEEQALHGEDDEDEDGVDEHNESHEDDDDEEEEEEEECVEEQQENADERVEEEGGNFGEGDVIDEELEAEEADDEKDEDDEQEEGEIAEGCGVSEDENQQQLQLRKDRHTSRDVVPTDVSVQHSTNDLVATEGQNSNGDGKGKNVSSGGKHAATMEDESEEEGFINESVEEDANTNAGDEEGDFENKNKTGTDTVLATNVAEEEGFIDEAKGNTINAFSDGTEDEAALVLTSFGNMKRSHSGSNEDCGGEETTETVNGNPPDGSLNDGSQSSSPSNSQPHRKRRRF